jgi:transposase
LLQNLSDRQAADAVRARIDWKYALGLELTNEGFHSSALSEFRTRLVDGSLEHVLLDRLLERCGERGWLKARGRQRTDSTHVLGAVRALNQLELVGETLRATLNVLATVAPGWLQDQVSPDWYERYGDRREDTRLPREKTEREVMSRRIGDDGVHLLACVEQAAQEGMDWLQQLPAGASGPDARADLGAAVSHD